MTSFTRIETDEDVDYPGLGLYSVTTGDTVEHVIALHPYSGDDADLAALFWEPTIVGAVAHPNEPGAAFFAAAAELAWEAQWL